MLAIFYTGAAYLDLEQGYDSSTEFAYSLGGGMRWYLMDNMGLRFDVRPMVLLPTVPHIFFAGMVTVLPVTVVVA